MYISASEISKLRKKSRYYVYIIECEGDHFYVGYTSNFFRRMDEHESGNGAAFTREYKPKEVIYVEPHERKSDAMERENEITLKLMDHFNDFDKIAGGDYPQRHKPKEVKEEIRRRLRGKK